MKEPPIGALTPEERTVLATKNKTSHYPWTEKRGYYAVHHRDGKILIGGRNGRHFSFSYTPDEAYYFTNYFHALAYSLQLKARKETENA